MTNRNGELIPKEKRRELRPSTRVPLKPDSRKRRATYNRAAAILITIATGAVLLSPAAHALDMPASKPKWMIDETKWMTLGVGFRGTGLWVENRGAGDFRNDFSIDNAR